MGTKVKVHHEVRGPISGGWQLTFQRVTYHYGETRPQNVRTPTQEGFRFIWRDPKNHLNAARGQARIPDADQLLDLLVKAKQAGWFIPKRHKL
jgi:hypothetical protein